MPTATEPLVVLGIVLDSHNRVLLVRRVGEERWIFPGGQSEPGEAEAETVVREVMEETGVGCEAMAFVGRRTHPESNRAIVYWRCKALSAAVAVRDTKEIAQAKWVPLPESLDLLGMNIFEPVKEILLSST